MYSYVLVDYYLLEYTIGETVKRNGDFSSETLVLNFLAIFLFAHKKRFATVFPELL